MKQWIFTKDKRLMSTDFTQPTIKDLVLQNQEAIAIKAISEKIYTLMQNIRNGSSDSDYQRRWVWELLQNAMDTTNSERDTVVEIEINKEASTLSFRHNGNPFMVDNITYLVNQQSSKPRKISVHEKTRTIGKFGTGFITTHLLSERVTLKSTVKAGSSGHKEFELLLDRSGNSEQELYDGVKAAMNVLLTLDTLPDVTDYNPNKTNTEFTYHLDDSGTAVAEVGINDLRVCLPYTMAFVRTIAKVSINEDLIFSYAGAIELDEGIYLHQIRVSDSDTQKQILTIESNEKDATIAFEVAKDGNKIQFIAPAEECPKLFCNYPFIGTEEFNTPGVLNSSSFNIYQERRNGIILKDADTPEIHENKELLKECNILFLKLLNFIDQSNYQFQDTFVLADFQQPKNYEWLSKKWYDTEILKPAHNALLNANIVEIERNGLVERTSIIKDKAYVDFPYHKDAEVREAIYDLCNVNQYFILPLKENIHHWHKINWWEEKYDLSIKNLVNWFSACGHINSVQKTLGLTEDKLQYWLDRFYTLINREESIINLVNQNKLKIYPNQNGDLCTKNAVFLDEGDIDPELKDILLALGYNCRAFLLEESLLIQGAIAIDREKLIGAKFIAQQIREKVAKFNADKVKGTLLSSETKDAFRRLFTWFVENPTQASDLFEDLYQNKEHRLCDEKDIAMSMELSMKATSLLEKYGVSNFEELEKMISPKIKKESSPLNPDHLLISLGITSAEDLERAKQENANNKPILEALQHISAADIERFKKVMAIIKRAVTNVQNHLQSLQDYDCTNWSQDSLTTVSGIMKSGKEINLVIRPADGGQIIIFYPEEVQALEKANTELWYDDEKEQNIYSFGRFLKRTKVNKLPV